MKTVFTAILIGLSCYCHAQSPSLNIKDNVELSNTAYLIVKYTEPTVLKQTAQVIDYGHGESKIVDNSGAVLKFGSPVEIMNFMYQRGWSYVHAYKTTRELGSTNIEYLDMVFKNQNK